MQDNNGVKSGCGFRLAFWTASKSVQAAVLGKASAKDNSIESP
jgi:hypothetical protein